MKISTETYNNNVVQKHEKPSISRRRRLLNKHLLEADTPVEGIFQLPQVLPYTGNLPDSFIPFHCRVATQSSSVGVYCNIHDELFNSTWSRPEVALNKVNKYGVAVAPDYTLWADGRICENIEQLRRNRTITRYWQSNGVPTIQTASWADAFSVDTYAFDGLAENSWTAIGHQRIGNKSEQTLFKYAIERLVEKKKTLGLVIFGAPLDFDPGVQIKVYPSFITKFIRMKKNGNSKTI